MRDLFFNLIVGLLGTLDIFKGEDGSSRVYDWPTTSPAGYPYVVVGSESFESEVLDNASDTRRYNFNIQIVGEKFGQEAGKTQSQALAAMRATEDSVIGLFDANFFLGRDDVVVRTMPVSATYGLTDGGSRVILTIVMRVDTRITITQS